MLGVTLCRSDTAWKYFQISAPGAKVRVQVGLGSKE
jgi:hypothetical protein